MSDKFLLRPAEAFARLGVGRSKGYELIASGEIPSIELGGCRRVPVDALVALINQRMDARRATPVHDDREDARRDS